MRSRSPEKPICNSVNHEFNRDVLDKMIDPPHGPMITLDIESSNPSLVFDKYSKALSQPLSNNPDQLEFFRKKIIKLQ